MTTETPASEAAEVALERERARVEQTRRFLNRSIWTLAVVFVGTIAVLAGTMLESYRNAQREAEYSPASARRRSGRAFAIARCAWPSPDCRPARAAGRCRFSRDSCRATCRCLPPLMIAIFGSLWPATRLW